MTTGNGVGEIERADERGDMRAIYQGVRVISGRERSCASKQPALKTDGSRISSPEELSQL